MLACAPLELRLQANQQCRDTVYKEKYQEFAAAYLQIYGNR